MTHSISSFTTSCQSSVPTLNSCSFPQSTTSLSGECFCQWTAAVMKNCLFCIFDRIFTIYTRTLPLDIACRVWDMFCRDGDSFLFRTALGTCVECIAWKYTLFPFYMCPHTYTCTHTHTHTHTPGILRLYQSQLLQFCAIEDAGQFLGKLPADISSEALFGCIEATHLTPKRFDQVVQSIMNGPSR